jgi:hypothetical protein
MQTSLHCPSCRRSLGRVQLEQVEQLICVRCRRDYGILHGKLSGWQSQRQTLFYLNDRLPKVYKRRYELRITTSTRHLKVLTFSLPGASDRVPARPGDRLSILYTGRGNAIRKLFAIHNHTNGRSYNLPKPIPSRQNMLLTRGMFGGAVLGAAIVGGLELVALPGIVGAIALYAWSHWRDVAELTTPALHPDNPLESRLLGEQHLAQQHQQLARRVDELQQEDMTHRDLMKRLRSLREKMLKVDASLYATRIGQIEKGIRLLQLRLQHNDQLVERYAEAMNLIDIELETASLADHLPDGYDFHDDLFTKLEELKAIEARNQDLRWQLEANEEVRRLTGVGS